MAETPIRTIKPGLRCTCRRTCAKATAASDTEPTPSCVPPRTEIAAGAASDTSREPPGLLEQESELRPAQTARLRAFMANAHLAFEVTAPTAGVVEQVLVAKGQTVDAGQPLAR